MELDAIRLALRSFQHLLLGCHVLVRSDNTSAFAYINRQGGVRSKQLNSLATEIHLWALPRFESLRAAHLPGYLNFEADLLSQGNIRAGEWVLHPRSVSSIGSASAVPKSICSPRGLTHRCPLWFHFVHFYSFLTILDHIETTLEILLQNFMKDMK